MYLHQRWVQRWRTPSPWFTLANAKACPSSKSSRASTAPASAVDMTRSLGVSDAVVGLTIVAIGTSAPKLATTIMDTPKNERDIAIGNLIGSSTYNILFILGVTCLATPSGVPVDAPLLHVDLPLAALVALLCVPIFVTDRRISRLEGALFVTAYAVYLGTLIFVRA